MTLSVITTASVPENCHVVLPDHFTPGVIAIVGHSGRKVENKSETGPLFSNDNRPKYFKESRDDTYSAAC